MAVLRDPLQDPLQGRSRPAPTRSDAELITGMLRIPPAHWAVLTGAGMSTDSGIPDYRGPNAVPRSPMTGQRFRAHPDNRTRYWARSWLGWKRMRQVRPNAGHLALARLRPGGIITQNVDGLHQEAGSAPVIDLHGRLDRVVCLDCGQRYSRELIQHVLDTLNADFVDRIEQDPSALRTAPDGDVDLETTEGFQVAACPRCGGILKTDVVYFGEPVPRERLEAAQALTDQAHGLVVLGTSLAVHSGLRFVRAAVSAGRPVVIVTDGPTRADDLPVERSVSRVADFTANWLSQWEESGRLGP